MSGFPPSIPAVRGLATYLFLTAKWHLGKVQLSCSILKTAPGKQGSSELGPKQSLEAAFLLEEVLPTSEMTLSWVSLPSPTHLQ